MADVVGIDDFNRAVDSLTRDLRRRVIYAALRAGARPIVRAAKANAPVKTGLVKKRIAVATSKIKRGRNGEIGVFIKPRISSKARKSKDRSQDPYYYVFQEAGFHAVGRRKVGGGRVNRAARIKASGARFIQGKKFMGRAFESNKGQALKAFSDTLKKRIDQANQGK